MNDTSGFYKWDDGQLLYAPNAVLMAGDELYREQKDSYTYPVNGWAWYDSADLVPVDRITSAAFILRFTPAEYSGIRTAGETDPKIAAVIAHAESEPFVWLGSKEVTDAMTYLVGAGLLTAQRAGEIVAY